MAKKRLSVKQTWWWNRDTQSRLMLWVKMILSRLAAEYRILLEDKGSGYHDSLNHLIQANCQLFAQEPVRIQFLVTQGILAHEAGHALHTGHLPDQRNTILFSLINILEDEREERCQVILFPGLQELFALMSKQFWRKSATLSGPDNQQAFDLCLEWRFAYRHQTNKDMLERLKTTPGAVAYWEKVKPLVEQAWDEKSVWEVRKIAEQILKILAIREDLPAPNRRGGYGTSQEMDLPSRRTEDPVPFPTEADPEIKIGAMHRESGKKAGGKESTRKAKIKGASEEMDPSTKAERKEEPSPMEEDLPADFDPETDTLYFLDDYSRPAPYAALELETALLATQIGDSMKLPDPYARTVSHPYKGRFSARQEIRHPDKPCRWQLGEDNTSHGIVVDLLVDRSGSMRVIDEIVQRALMALYRGHTRADVRIPTGIKYFGADGLKDKVLTVAPISPDPSEEALALIAGYHGDTSNEFLYWALTESYNDLGQWNKHHKVCIVIHDGDPVYRGAEGNDFELSRAFIQCMTEEGILVIGLYLGDNEEWRPTKLEVLFGDRLIRCKPKDLPERLSRMLITIVSGQD
jgi:hypothetical protein